MGSVPVSKALTSREDELKTRLEALRSTLQLTDRVLTGDSRVTLRFCYGDLWGSNCPAMSVGPAITVDIDQVPNPHAKSGLVHILGLNYHEVGHVRYGIDRRQLRNRVQGRLHQRFDEAYEILEEGRIETLLGARYEKLKKYFTYPVVEYFVKEQGAWGTAFMYTHGRKYLPRTIRDTFRAKFEDGYGKEVTAKMTAVIDQYRLLSFSEERNITTGARLINRFAGLLEEVMLPVNNPHKQQHQTGGMTSQSSEPEAEEAKRQDEEQKEQEKNGKDGSGFREREEEPEEEDAEEDEQEGGSGGESEDGDEDSSGDSEEEDSTDSEEGESDGPGGGEDLQEDDAGDSDGRNVGDSPDADDPDMDFDGGGRDSGDDSDGLPEDGSSSTSSNGAGTGAGRDQDFELDARELAEELAETLAEVLESEHVQNDVAQLQDAMADQAGLNSTLDRRMGMSMAPVTPEMVNQSERLASVLREMWAQMEPGWEYGLSEGNRIDMNRAAMIRDVEDYDSIYVDWSEGQQDNAGLCAVVLVDKSSSMGGSVYAKEAGYLGTRANVVSKNLWEIRKALDEIDATVAVIDFDYECCTMYDTEEKTDPSQYANMYPSGGTNPHKAIEEARRILSMTDMPNKLLVILTDGEWGGNPRDILYSGFPDVVKVAILIGNLQFDYTSCFDVTARTSGDIFDPIAQAVVAITERSMNR